MNQKEFELIAEVLKANLDDGGELTIIYGFADRLEEQYPATFDKDKFMKSCGL